MIGKTPIGGKLYYFARTHKGFLFNRLTKVNHELVIFQYYEKSLKEYSIMYDIGANIGVHTIAASQKIINNKGKIICFEPDPSNLKLLKKNIKLNEIESLCEVVSSAVSNCIGQVKFQRDLVSGATGNLSSIREVSLQHEWTDRKGIEISIDCVTIDFIVFEKRFLPPDIVKIDVEGAEYIVLEGMQRTMREYHPDIVIDGMTQECFSILKYHGYNLYDLTSNMLSINQHKDCSYSVLASVN
jgi:FkbM family methyltransferase